MNIRELSEENEYAILSESAVKARETLGRADFEEKCDIRTEFQRDRDRIIHSKAFRRLKHKTQVFLSPEGDHYRTRLTHTLEVAQIARTIARALRLNEDLTEAIALGHDLGHTPFGHCGEDVLNPVHKSGFKHNEQSLRVVELLETRGNGRVGLNLTKEVKDGILNHNGPNMPHTLEGQVVKISDRIAYINHDIDDAIRARVLSLSEIDSDIISVIGKTHSQRINTLIVDLIKNSSGSNQISFSKNVDEKFTMLRRFMFEHVYLDVKAKREESKAAHVIEALYEIFAKEMNKLPEAEYSAYSKNGSMDVIKDYIAGMSDVYAINKYQEIFVPLHWK